MIQFSYVTRGGSPAQGKPRVCFTCHPDDFAYLEEIKDLILERQNCAVFYLPPGTTVEQKEDYLFDLNLMQLLVVPVTTKLLTQPSRARDTDIPFAAAHHIPILPLMQESGLDRLFNNVIGNIQFLNPKDTDVTAISFDEKLTRFLDSVLVRDGLSQKIRDAFDAYIFLSYRKKDRRHANRLMQLIHGNPEYRDIAIWYDEFLVPGEDFNEAIRKAFENSSVFALAVTPHLLETGNYVKEIEFPMAKKSGIGILPVEMYDPEWNDPRTDRQALGMAFKGIGDVQDEHRKKEVDLALEKILCHVARREHGDSPEQKMQHDFLIGLAYLNGIDVEEDGKRAADMITGCADAGYAPALDQLVVMYENGKGVGRDYAEAINRQEQLAAVLEKEYRKAPGDEEKLRLLIEALCSLGDKCREQMQWERAETAYNRMMAFCGKHETPLFRRYTAVGYSMLGITFEKRYEFDQAARCYEQASELRKSLPEQTDLLPEAAESENRAADLYMETGRTELARQHYALMETILRKYDALTRTLRSRLYLSVGLHKMGLVNMALGRYDEAERYLEENLELSRQAAEEMNSADGRRMYGVSLQNLGDLYLERGDLARAEEMYRSSMDLGTRVWQETGAIRDAMALSIDCEKMSDLCLARGDLNGAGRHLHKAGELAEQAAALAKTPQTLSDLGTVYFKLGELERENGHCSEAKAYYQKSRDTIRQIEADRLPAEACILLADDDHALGLLALEQNDPVTAQKYFMQAMDARERLAAESQSARARRDLGISCHTLGDIALENEDLEKAEGYCRRGYGTMLGLYEDCRTANTAGDLAISLDKLGNIAKKAGNRDEARSHYLRALELRQEAVKTSSSADAFDALAVSHYKLGILERDRQHLVRALDIWTQLSEQCPDVGAYKRQRDIAAKKICDLDLMTSAPPAPRQPEKKSFWDRFRKK